MVLEVSSSTNQAALYANCKAKCFEYAKTGARPKNSTVRQEACGLGATKAKETKASTHGSWGPIFKNKQNFVDMHLC